MLKEDVSRRSFLKQTGVGLAAFSAAPAIIPSRAFGANDRVNLAVVGIRSQGGAHIDGFGRLDDVQIHTLVDIDENLWPGRVREVEEKFGNTPKTVYDMRAAFDDPDVDAVTFATPNHWHALGSIWAAQAGKHVYVEKPASYSIWEGRQMVNAARAHDVVMQVGFQNRSRPSTIAAMQLLHDGGIGEVYMARGLCYKPRWDIGRYPDGPMPDTAEAFFMTTNGGGRTAAYTRDYLSRVHYDLWIGPASELPFNPNRFHYNWHWQWEYGNGDTGNQGPHQMDIGRWGLGQTEYPVRVKSSGGYYVFDSAQDTPNVQTTVFEYADGRIFVFDTRGLYTNKDGNIHIGNIFYGSEGRLEIDADGNWQTYFGYNDEPGPSSERIEAEEANAMLLAGTGASQHYENFVYAVRAADPSLLTCDIEIGHRSSVLSHLGNVAYRVGRELVFDGATETFAGDDAANALLARDNYRAPYVVPDLS